MDQNARNLLVLGIALGVAQQEAKRKNQRDKSENHQNARLLETLRLCDETINELGGVSVEHAAVTWAKGICSGNGVMQYSMMTKGLKTMFKRIIKNQKNSWVFNNNYSNFSIEEVKNKSRRGAEVKVSFKTRGSKKIITNFLYIVKYKEVYLVSAIK